MPTSKSGFVSRVRTRSIKGPNARGFELGQWVANWESCGDTTKESKQLLDAGIVFHKSFEELRAKIKTVHGKYPAIDRDEVIRCFVALANRDMNIISAQSVSQKGSSIFSKTISANKMNTELTLTEAADGCVDGVALAIREWSNRPQGGVHRESDGGTLFLTMIEEANLSQVYHAMEDYWQALLWGDFEFITKSKIVHCIIQKKTDLEVKYELSEVRKIRALAIPGFVFDRSLSVRGDYLHLENKFGRRSILIGNLATASYAVKSREFILRWSIDVLKSELPVDLIAKESEIGFSILDCIEVFKILAVFSISLSDRFPKVDSIVSIADLKKFCPLIDRSELLRALDKITNFGAKKVRSVLEFLEFNATRGKDLWCHPLIPIRGKYALSTSVLQAPNILRVAEHWLVGLKSELDSKGSNFEDILISECNDELSRNSLLIDINPGRSKRFKFESGEEEIDLIFRFGNVILMAEAKSIVTTDSPISKHRTLERLSEAATQVKRKSAFIKNNLREIFSDLNWPFEALSDYKVVGCIVNSSKVYVGASIDCVPVCDKEMLKMYFSSGKLPIYSGRESRQRDFKHYAWFNLYSDFFQFTTNLEVYLRTVPQILETADDLVHMDLKLPRIEQTSDCFLFSRLVLKDRDMRKKLQEAEREFSIGKADDLEQFLESIDVTF